MIFPSLTLAFYGAWAALFLQISLGVIFIVHGIAKLKAPSGIAQAIGFPPSCIFLLGILETLGGILVITGLFTQLGALAIMMVMLGALYFKIFRWHIPFTAIDKTGWEFDLILLAVALVFLCSGL